ncbi:ParB/Srx family N-terminal domain-containing protein [Bradyrhizobium sp. RT3b]|uniref:ParB/Srx family N-terminal domain-containing protein n=1 Tax=Bradyrhizobium sp. RT3b TaxID=3156334 RepID=UPI00339AD2EF
MTEQFTVIQGKQVPYTITRISNDQLELDPANPRVQYLVGQMAGDITQSRLDELIWAKDQVKALAQSIFQNGGIREPIIVQPTSKGKYRVREGNSRTICNRHLAEQHPGDDRFAFVPAHVFQHNLTEEDIAVMLADFHVAGKIRWDAYEQAKHIHDLFHVYGKTYDWLSDHLRMSKTKISEHLAAYKATTDFLQIHPAPANIKKFSLFQELMKKKDLRERYDNSPEFRQQVYTWLEKDRISDAKQMRSLPDVLQNPEATKALNGDGFDAAAKVLINNDPALGSDLFHAVKAATAALKAAPASDIQDLKAGNAQKLIMLRNLKRSLEDIGTLAGITL